ncbi:hypothetical protein BJX99DRAFT_261290 [Aspergillus californicus]
MSFLLLCLTLFSSLTTAHFSLTYPAPRGINADNMPEFPCGGFSPSSNRTQIHLSASGASLPISINMGHDQTAVQFLLGIGNNPETNYNITLRKTFRVEGLGALCLPGVVIDEDVLGTEVGDGLNVTLQVVANGHPSGGLYTCADLQLTTATIDSPDDTVCANNTGIAAIPFTGAAADRNANASTADGEAQSGESDHDHDHDSGNETSTETETNSADSPTSTDGAAELQTAAWGVLILGTAVMAGLIGL